MKRAKNPIVRKYERMKNGKPPRVVLEHRCIEILVRKQKRQPSQRGVLMGYRNLQYFKRHDINTFADCMLILGMQGAIGGCIIAEAMR